MGILDDSFSVRGREHWKEQLNSVCQVECTFGHAAYKVAVVSGVTLQCG